MKVRMMAGACLLAGALTAGSIASPVFAQGSCGNSNQSYGAQINSNACTTPAKPVVVSGNVTGLAGGQGSTTTSSPSALPTTGGGSPDPVNGLPLLLLAASLSLAGFGLRRLQDRLG